MATLSITRLYADNEILFEADLDEVISDVETFINTTKLNDDNIQAAGITASSKFVAQSVTGSLIETSSVVTTKIAAGAVGTDALGTGAITTAKIAAATLDGAPFANNSVTVAKLDRPSARFSFDTISDNTSSTSEQTLGGSPTITATGNRPVLVGLAGTTTTAAGSTIALVRTFAASGIQTLTATFYIYEGATLLGTFNLKLRPNRATSTSTVWSYIIPPALISTIYTPTAGIKSYSLKAKVDNASATLTLSNVDFFVIELV